MVIWFYVFMEICKSFFIAPGYNYTYQPKNLAQGHFGALFVKCS